MWSTWSGGAALYACVESLLYKSSDDHWSSVISIDYEHTPHGATFRLFQRGIYPIFVSSKYGKYGPIFSYFQKYKKYGQTIWHMAWWKSRTLLELGHKLGQTAAINHGGRNILKSAHKPNHLLVYWNILFVEVVFQTSNEIWIKHDIASLFVWVAQNLLA